VRALILSADDFEDSELLVPYYRLKEEGIEVDIVAPARGSIRGKHGYEVEATRAAAEVRPDEHDFLIIPGGLAPEALSDDRVGGADRGMVPGRAQADRRNLSRAAGARCDRVAGGTTRHLPSVDRLRTARRAGALRRSGSSGG